MTKILYKIIICEASFTLKTKNPIYKTSTIAQSHLPIGFLEFKHLFPFVFMCLAFGEEGLGIGEWTSIHL